MAEPRREELALVFAEFGAACHQAQLLEEVLRLLLLTGREYARLQVADDQLRYPMDDGSKKTLGALFRDVLAVESVRSQDCERIFRGIEVRNWLIHRYWDHERSTRMQTPGGRLKLIEELQTVCKLLRDATGLVHPLIDRYLAAHGLSVKHFMDQAGKRYVNDIQPPTPEDFIN